MHDTFAGPALDAGLWVPHYLPHWTTPERSAARYDLVPGGLRLRIDHDQPAWRPEDGEMRVSNLQTGSWAGPVGGTRGQHRHRPDGLVVRTATPTRRLWTPSSGEVEVVVSASPDPTCMVGVWLVGFEESSPDDSGEICLAELFGDQVGPGGSTVRLGIKAHHDPRLRTDLADVRLPLDATTPHTYAAHWDATGVRLLVDGDTVWTSDQVLAYPLQLMIDLFEFPAGPRDPGHYPRTAVVRSVTGTDAP
ncbi:glycoside hydrolase family 16 protein [Promicromonospora sp. NFX87]|uniref:glycoside hydrolase family 16 protein n=1 Tax=Promicromonospora sp. NFX87 TaxID=3402691 RepID=UPI003AFB5057